MLKSLILILSGVFVDFFVATIMSILNMFFSHYVLNKIGIQWDLAFLKPEIFTFKVYFGCIFAFIVFATPSLGLLINQKEDTPKLERLPSSVLQIMISCMLLTLWFGSWASNSIFY